MPPEALFALILLALLLGLVVGLPLAALVAALAFIGISSIGDVPFELTAQTIVGRLYSPALMSLALFLLLGELMNEAGIVRRILGVADVLIGHTRGGLAHVNVLMSTIDGGISGSSSADAAYESKILVPVMIEKGYSPGFAGSVTAVSAVLAPVIPPSIAMVVYATAAGISIGQLFIAGLIPGLLLTLAMMGTIWILARTRNWTAPHSKSTRKEVRKALREAAPALLYPVIFLVGVRLGILTVTEAAAVAVLYTLLLGTLVYRELPVTHLPGMVARAAIDTGGVMLIVAVTAPIAWLLAVERMPEAMGSLLVSIAEPLLFLLAVNVLFLGLGMLMDSIALIILMTPILGPIADSFGIDPIHFGIVMTVNLVLGAITPPVGSNVFVISVVAKIPAEEIFREILPFLPGLFVVLGIITFIPEISLWLGGLLGP